MTVISADSYVPRHTNPNTPPVTSPGSDYIGRHGKPEPDWFATLPADAMQAPQLRLECGHARDLDLR